MKMSKAKAFCRNINKISAVFKTGNTPRVWDVEACGYTVSIIRHASPYYIQLLHLHYWTSNAYAEL